MSADPRTAAALAPARRFALTLAGWVSLFGATPGALTPDGSLLLAVLGVALWGSAAVRPLGERRWRGRLAEGLANAIGSGSILYWVAYVVPPGVAYIGLGMAVYFALGAGLGRALLRRYPTPFAIALAFWAGEAARTVLPPPLGLPWFQLGHHTHHHLWLAGSARLWGVEGSSLVVALVGGSLAAWLPLVRLPRRRSDPVWGFAALALAALVAVLTSPPASVPGPRVLVVQPGWRQDEKQFRAWHENHAEVLAQTLDALAELEASGVPPVDLVAWGETMLQVDLFEPGVREALARGLNVPPWRKPITDSNVRGWGEMEDQWVRRALLARFPEGTAFLAGAVVWDLWGEEIRPRNAVVLYDGEGRRAPAVSKRYLVSGAESVHGLERFAWVRAITDHFMRYTPDFVTEGRTGVLELPAREGLPGGRDGWAMGASVCFDNGFVTPYIDPLREGPVDFHVVLSNEAWYEGSFEMDQMIALSRFAALASGRAVVRATNSGISALLGPDGRELDRLRVDGVDRLVAGHAVFEVPVPEDPAAGAPPYGALRGGLRLLLGAAVLGLAGSVRRPRRDPRRVPRSALEATE